MAKKLIVDIVKLGEAAKNKDKIFNIRINGNLYDSFQKVCKKELSQKPSKVVRNMIEQICRQYGYTKW